MRGVVRFPHACAVMLSAAVVPSSQYSAQLEAGTVDDQHCIAINTRAVSSTHGIVGTYHLLVLTTHRLVSIGSGAHGADEIMY